VVLVAAGAAMSRVAFTGESASEHLFLLYYDLPAGSPIVRGLELPIVLSFVLSATSFAPLGQFVAERLNEFMRRSSALSGYCWDILGSLLGVAAFALVSFTGAFPIAWFAIFLACGLLLYDGPSGRRFAYLAMAGLVLLIVLGSERAERYSPYYALALHERPNARAFEVLTNGSLHQRAFPIARSDEEAMPELSWARDGYHVPYRLLARPPRHALVVGAGTGNDVAVLLDEGAERIDAVEIDPAILDLGRRHPNHPYASPKVHAINTDARSFLNHTSEHYDLIVFGTLDSMTRLSALSNVRLDNFVYTSDCLRTVRDHLTSDGGLVMYYMVPTRYIDLRLVGMLTQVFGEEPLVVSENYGFFSRILMSGPAFDGQKGAERRANAPEVLKGILSEVELPGDDWPYLYLSHRGINGFYLTLMAVFGVIAVLGVALSSEEMRHSLGSKRVDGEMFFFGIGFLLLETRSVTQMNLAWGGTWLTNAVVFGSILGVVLIATLSTLARPVPYHLSMGALAVSLLAAYALPVRFLLGSGTPSKLALSFLFVGAPVFFAALSFASLFRDRERAATAFGWNLLGAVAGGLIEFASMAIGLRALLLVALLAYLLALLVHLRGDEVAPSHSGAEVVV
ncbi:MAG: hypothetical protein ACHQNV_05180, partial [Vicinamibacteria bacterium]